MCDKCERADEVNRQCTERGDLAWVAAEPGEQPVVRVDRDGNAHVESTDPVALRKVAGALRETTQALVRQVDALRRNSAHALVMLGAVTSRVSPVVVVVEEQAQSNQPAASGKN